MALQSHSWILGHHKGQATSHLEHAGRKRFIHKCTTSEGEEHTMMCLRHTHTLPARVREGVGINHDARDSGCKQIPSPMHERQIYNTDSVCKVFPARSVLISVEGGLQQLSAGGGENKDPQIKTSLFHQPQPNTSVQHQLQASALTPCSGMAGRLKLDRSCGEEEEQEKTHSGGQAQMNSIDQRPGAFSSCFLSTLLFRGYSSRLNDKEPKLCEKILVSHGIHTATVTHLSIPGSLFLAAGKLKLTCHCLSRYT